MLHEEARVVHGRRGSHRAGRRPGWLGWGAMLLGLSVIVIAGCNDCGDAEPCERAIERLVNECNYEVEVEGSGALCCMGEEACIAGCWETSPCDDIRNDRGEYAACVATCQEK